MPATPTRRLAHGLGAIAAISALAEFGPEAHAEVLRDASHDVGHVLVFAILAATLLPLLQARWSRARALAATAALTLSLGALVEIAQFLTGGDASLGDLARDMLGYAIGVTVCLARGSLPGDDSPQPAAAPGHRRAFWILAALGLVATFIPLVRTAMAYPARVRLLPLLADPNVPASLELVEIEPPLQRLVTLPAPWSHARGERAIAVSLEPGPWPGLRLREPAPDWRAYRALQLDLVNPGAQPLELVLRVDDGDSRNDVYAQRYNGTLVLPAGSRRMFVLPLAVMAQTPSGRRLDLGSIERVILFSDGAQPGRTFLVCSLRLTRS